MPKVVQPYSICLKAIDDISKEGEEITKNVLEFLKLCNREKFKVKGTTITFHLLDQVRDTKICHEFLDDNDDNSKYL